MSMKGDLPRSTTRQQAHQNPAEMGEDLWAPSFIRSCWQLVTAEVGNPFFSWGVTTGGFPKLPWLASHPYTNRLTGFSGLKKKDMKSGRRGVLGRLQGELERETEGVCDHISLRIHFCSKNF